MDKACTKQNLFLYTVNITLKYSSKNFVSNFYWLIKILKHLSLMYLEKLMYLILLKFIQKIMIVNKY